MWEDYGSDVHTVGFFYLVGDDVAAGDAAAYESVEEEVDNGHDGNPVGGEVSAPVGDDALDQRQDASAEEAGGHGCVLAQALGGEVEDSAPHDGSAQTTEHDEEHGDAHGHHGEAHGRGVDARHAYLHGAVEAESTQEHDDDERGDDGKHGLRRDFAADDAAVGEALDGAYHSGDGGEPGAEECEPAEGTQLAGLHLRGGEAEYYLADGGLAVEDDAQLRPAVDARMQPVDSTFVYFDIYGLLITRG